MRDFSENEHGYEDPRDKNRVNDPLKTVKGVGAFVAAFAVVVVVVNYVESKESPPDYSCQADFENPNPPDCDK